MAIPSRFFRRPGLKRRCWRFGFDAAFRAALTHVFERGDGSGYPDRAKAEALPLALRVAHVATDANVGHRFSGIETALTLVQERAGRGLDSDLSARFVKVAARACAGLEQPSPWSTAMDAEPSPRRLAAPAAAERRFWPWRISPISSAASPTGIRLEPRHNMMAPMPLDSARTAAADPSPSPTQNAFRQSDAATSPGAP
jgi:hypothetical protein